MRGIAIVGTLAIGVLAWAVAGSAVADQPDQAANHFPSETDARDCPEEGDDDQIVFEGSKTLWPPNHKYRSLTVTAVGDDEDEMVTLSTTVTSDQPDNGIGDGNTADDTGTAENPPVGMASGQGSAGPITHVLRGERSGKPLVPGEPDPGRTYTITAEATFDNGMEQCEATFEVNVPHDMRGKKSL